MENKAKAIEYITQHLTADYFKKLVDVKIEKLVLFPSFPFTGAPNVSAPQYFALILNIEILSDLFARSIN